MAEIGNVFWKRAVLRQDIGDSEVTALYDELVKTPPALIEIRALAPRAFEIAINVPHPVYDCFYIAAAEHLGCDLITADERMAAKFSTDFPFIRRLSTI